MNLTTLDVWGSTPGSSHVMVWPPVHTGRFLDFIEGERLMRCSTWWHSPGSGRATVGRSAISEGLVGLCAFVPGKGDQHGDPGDRLIVGIRILARVVPGQELLARAVGDCERSASGE